MEYSNEDEVKQALGIKSWRNLSRANVVSFAAMMPQMDKELAVKIVEQFPVFTKFGLDALRSMERVQESALGFNERSQKKVHDAYQDVRDAIKGELRRDDLTPEERQRLIDTMMDSAEKDSAKDSENKRLIGDIVKTAAVVTTGVLLTAVVVLGAKVVSEQGESDPFPES